MKTYNTAILNQKFNLKIFRKYTYKPPINLHGYSATHKYS